MKRRCDVIKHKRIRACTLIGFILLICISERDGTARGSDFIIAKQRKFRISRGWIYFLTGFGCLRCHGAFISPRLAGISTLFSTSRDRRLVLKPAAQVGSYLWSVAEFKICSGRQKREKSCSRSGLLNTTALEEIQSRGLCFGATRKSRWSALRLDLWVGVAWRKVIRTKLLCVLEFSTASALRVGPWTFLALFTALNALHYRSAVTHRHSAAVLCSLCRSRTLWQRLTTNDLLTTLQPRPPI